MEGFTPAGMLALLGACQKCGTPLEFVGWDEDEYGPHMQFVCPNREQHREDEGMPFQSPN